MEELMSEKEMSSGIIEKNSIYGIVYCIENKIDTKQYYGQTSRDVNQRWRIHKSLAKKGKGEYLHKAIRKYGWDNFSKKIICSCGDQLSLDIMEDLCISIFNSLVPNGYNLRRGGHPSGKPTKLTKQKLSIITKKRFEDPKEREKLSIASQKRWENLEERKKLSDKTKERLKDPRNHPMYGKHHSEESKRKMSEKTKKRFEDPEERKKFWLNLYMNQLKISTQRNKNE